MMRFVVVDGILHAPESWHAFIVKGNVIRSAHFAEGGFGKADFAIARERIEDVRKRLARLIIPHQADGQRFSSAGVVNEDGGNFAEFVFVLLHVFARSVETLFFPTEKNEANCALWLNAGFHERASGFDDRRGACAVVGGSRAE